MSYYTTRTRLRRLADDKASFGPSYEPGSRISGGFRIPVSLNRPPSLGGRARALSGGSEAPGGVGGDALYDASYASRAQHHRTATTAVHALRRLPTIASALSHQKEQFPNDVSTRGDVDACSRASRV